MGEKDHASRTMLPKKIMVVWVVWIVLSSCCYFLAGQAAVHHTGGGQRLRFGEALTSWLHLPGPDQLLQPATHEQLQHEQRLMMEALQRQRDAEQRPPASKTPAGATAQDVLQQQQERWPDGYLAVCAVVKDQGRDLRYWIEYHRWLGVSKFYIYDNNSTMPAMMVLWDYLRQGVVDYQYFLGKPRRKPDFTDTNQYAAYHSCLLQHFRQHRWLAFIDVDEFFVFNGNSSSANSSSSSQQDSASGQGPGGLAAAAAARRALRDPAGVALPAAAAAEAAAAGGGSGGGGEASSSEREAHSLPLFLHDFERHAALGVNWVLFGSSGLQQRPRQGPLGGFAWCVPQGHWESTHVKVIANTGGILGVGPTPHEVQLRPGMTTVDVDGQPFRGPKTPAAKWHKLVLHHYVLKSKAEFATKSARGSGAGNVKTWGYWDYIESLSNTTCARGTQVSRAFLASGPRLRQPREGGHFCSRATQAAAGARLAGAAAAVLAREEHGAPSQWNLGGIAPGSDAAGAGGAAGGDAAGEAGVDDDNPYDWE